MMKEKIALWANEIMSTLLCQENRFVWDYRPRKLGCLVHIWSLINWGPRSRTVYWAHTNWLLSFLCPPTNLKSVLTTHERMLNWWWWYWCGKDNFSKISEKHQQSWQKVKRGSENRGVSAILKVSLKIYFDFESFNFQHLLAFPVSSEKVAGHVTTLCRSASGNLFMVYADQIFIGPL